MLNPFIIKHYWPKPVVLDANEVPIYDMFICRGNEYVCMLGPYYATKALGDSPTLELDGFGPIIGSRVECPWHFTAVYLFPLPVAARARSELVATYRKGKAFHKTCTLQVPSREPKGKLAAMTRLNFPTSHLREWLEYHRQIGIEHFYIYGESSITGPDITVVPWPYPHKPYPVGEWDPWWPNDSHLYSQPASYTHACYRWGDLWDWLVLFDADEFFVPNSAATLPGVLDTVPSEDSAGWMVSGKWFGNSGHREAPLTSILDYYTKCEHGYTSAAKCIVRPELVRTFEIHQCNADKPLRDMSTKHLYFNHYRAISEYKRRRGPEFDDEFSNEATDHRILRVRDGMKHVETNLDPALCNALQTRFGLRYFVETGTFWGSTTQRMAKQFERLWTIELFGAQYYRARERLKSLEHVQCIFGNSPEELLEIIPQLDKPTMFWLDAHYSGGGTAKGDKECPLMEELEAIGRIGQHVILIDDARMFFETPDPNTHDASDWPRFADIKRLVDKWEPAPHVQVVGDVIVITPEK